MNVRCCRSGSVGDKGKEVLLWILFAYELVTVGEVASAEARPELHNGGSMAIFLVHEDFFHTYHHTSLDWQKICESWVAVSDGTCILLLMR
jgi:hypothetical protein